MENIEFIGITRGIVEIQEVESYLPNFANKVDKYANDMSVINCILAVVPIIVIILMFLIKKIKKYHIKDDFNNILKKDFEKYNLKKWKKIVIIELKYIGIIILSSTLFIIVNLIFHEMLHAICEIFFKKNIIIGFDITSLMGYVKTLSPIYTKYEKITILIMPVIITGIVPIIICFIRLKKSRNKIIISFLIILFCTNIAISCSDLINTYNYIRYIPNGAMIHRYHNQAYYYIL